MNNIPVTIGFTYKSVSFGYTPLWSDRLLANGYSIVIEYEKAVEKDIKLFLSIKGDRYPRVNWGGVTFAGGIEYQNLRLGLQEGWLTGGVKPCIGWMVSL